MTTALVGYYDWDTIRLRYRANAAPATLDAYVLYEYDSEPGVAYRDTIPTVSSFTTTWAEILTEGDPAGGGGGGIPGCKVVGGGVFLRSSATSLVKGSMYVRLVIARQNTAYEECLCCGYVYDAKPFLSIGEHADLEMSEAVATMDVTYQQANVGGGAVVVEIVPGAGSAFEVLRGRAINSGTNTISVETRTAAGGVPAPVHYNIASGAGTTLYFGKGKVNTAETTASSAGLGDGLTVGTEAFTVRQTGAGAQNDTFRVLITIRVKGALPTVSKANSTNPADVTVTAGAASFAFVG